jgi:DNA-binding PadR family transcriptional regulator
MFRDQKIQRHILHVLARQPDHGYSIAQQIIARAKGLLDGQESLLYPALYQHEADGTIESYMTQSDGHALRYYRLTEKGTAVVAKEEDRATNRARGESLIMGDA